MKHLAPYQLKFHHLDSMYELYAGNFSFLDNGKVKIQLQSVKERNQLILGDGYVEILETKTGSPYQFFEDFQLDKIA